jgi:hypothetical protein
LSWKLYPPQNIGKKLLLLFLIAWGIVGSVSGFYVGVLGLIANIHANPSPWLDIFDFNCN